MIPSSDQSPANETPPSTPQPISGWFRRQARHLTSRAWNFVCRVAQYYWMMRQPLWEYLAGFLPDLASESVRLRTVRLHPDESYRSAEFGPEGWKVSMTGRCVVCGERTQEPPIDESRQVENAARAFWIPAAATLLGPSIGWLLFGSWFASLSLPLGLAAGYLLRGKVSVLLRLVRCQEHTTRGNIPQVLAWGNTLVLRFGNKTVRKVFLYGETRDLTVPQPDAPGPGVYSAGVDSAGIHAASEYVPETIPLADSPDPETSRITHDLPPVFGTDDQSRSSTVP